MKKLFSVLILSLILFGCSNKNIEKNSSNESIQNSYKSNLALSEVDMTLNKWLSYRNEKTKLFPQYSQSTLKLFLREFIKKDSNLWTPENSAADLFPYLFLATRYTQPNYVDKLIETFNHEKSYSKGGMPEVISTQNGNIIERTLDGQIFGAAEYVKDGLVPLFELEGKSIWSDRAVEIMDFIINNSNIKTDYGRLPSIGTETNGNVLQSLVRLYRLNNDSKYIEYGEGIADFYINMLKENNSTLCDWDFVNKICLNKLNLRDHGNEILPALIEFFYIEKELNPKKFDEYYPELKAFLDKLLILGRNNKGMWIAENKLNDNWGYILNGYYTFFLATNDTKYLDVVFDTFRIIQDYDEWGTMDSYADSIESAIYLLKYIPINISEWIDRMIEKMYRKGLDYDYKDGNFIRTCLLYSLYKTQGTYLDPWRKDVKLGAYIKNDVLYLHIRSNKPWSGKIWFDIARHKQFFNMSQDYPRLNAFPEWFVLEDKKYKIISRDYNYILTKDFLEKEGLTINLNSELDIEINKVDD